MNLKLKYKKLHLKILLEKAERKMLVKLTPIVNLRFLVAGEISELTNM